jgi:pimeloyl-ACP methyl ester carboxylesterase
MRSQRPVIFARFCYAALLLGLVGCAHLAVVKTKPAELPEALNAESALEPARKYLAASEHKPPLGALGDDLLAAKTCYHALMSRPNDGQARSLYNFSVARAVEALERTNLQPWKQPVSVVTEEGRCVLTSPKPKDSEHDPNRYDLYLTDSLKIGGKFFKTRRTVDGIGAPLVAVERRENAQSRKHYELRRIYASITALIKFNGRRAELDFVDPLMTERVVLGDHVFPLAADFSASIAMLMARERPERIGFARVIHPEAYADTAGLFQLQQFDPARNPVIFVHGLQETPASWAPMIDSLRDDPWIREHYQFWLFSYPSGYPYPYSAALLRGYLHGIEHAFPMHKRIVLIGHSMGGMICRLLITDAGDKIWLAFFGKPPGRTPLTGETRKLLEESLVFNHSPEIKRVIFISTPHRGSKLASGWIGRVGASLVRTPQRFTSIYNSAEPLLIADPAARELNRMPNSIDTLEPNDRFVEEVNKIPITPGIPYDSIMGDRGRGDTPNSSDGVVPYWSSHLDGAQSELIVNSNHSAEVNSQAIREVKRILRTYP